MIVMVLVLVVYRFHLMVCGGVKMAVVCDGVKMAVCDGVKMADGV